MRKKMLMDLISSTRYYPCTSAVCTQRPKRSIAVHKTSSLTRRGRIDANSSFERDRGNDQHIQNARLPTADVVLNRVATIAASADVWGLKMWSLRHAPSSNPVKNFWCMHEWIAELCCFSLKVHFNHGDAEPCKRDDRDTQDTYWTDTVDVFDNVAFLLMMSPSCEARKGGTCLLNYGQQLRKRYEMCITTRECVTKSGFLWDKIEKLKGNVSQKQGTDSSDEDRLRTLSSLARSLDSQIISLSFLSTSHLMSSDEAILASPIVSVTEMALDNATSLREHLISEDVCYDQNPNSRNIFLWWQALLCIGYATLASKFVIEESKIRSEGEGTEEHPIAGKDTKRKSKHSILVSKATKLLLRLLPVQSMLRQTPLKSGL